MAVNDFVGELFDPSDFSPIITQNKIRPDNSADSLKDKIGLEVFRHLEKVTQYQCDDATDHNYRVGDLSATLALRLGMSDHYAVLISQAARLHDLGKITISNSILLKSGKLTVEERELMQEHCQSGSDLLSGTDSELLNMAKSIAIAHHERWNGDGYPFKLVTTAIPLEARIVAVADVFDALANERPYKKAWLVGDIISLFIEKSGIHFDPLVVNALLEMLHSEYDYSDFQYAS